MSNRIAGIIAFLIVLAMPIFLVLTLTYAGANGYLPYEYGKPDFPPDPYGFTQAQRLELARVSLDYLLVPDPPEVAIEMLRVLRLPGTDQPLFDPYELSHMVDVKRFIDVLRKVQLIASIVVLGGLFLLLVRPKTRAMGCDALLYGGGLTAVLLLALAGFVLLSWRQTFIIFHELFFPPGTWTFDWGNSLIRLFPDRFWFDAGTLLTVGSLVLGLLVALAGYICKRRLRPSREI